jgi:chorismate mutase / prephenate dehydratase
MDIDYLREQINTIDETLVELFIKRMEVVNNVALYKKENSVPLVDKVREEEIIKKHLMKADTEVHKLQIREFLESLMDISKKAQNRMLNDTNYNFNYKEVDSNCTVGFQGVKGSYSHQALMECFDETLIKSKCYLSFKDVFEGLRQDEIKYGILPIENSSTGGIAEVYDLLGEYNFYIVGEKSIQVDHNLLGVPGTDISKIEEVYSHTQGFLQCSQFFENYPQWKLIPYFNTAKSAEYIEKEKALNKACVASRAAAELYGLDILNDNINNSSKNYTRFIVISKDIKLEPKCDKISVVISLHHKTGALYNIMKHFAENATNMLKIESRPILDKSWQYFFYIDFNGNLNNDNTSKVIKAIREESIYFKLLGNYICEVNL